MKDWLNLVLEIADIHKEFVRRNGQAPNHRPKGPKTGWSVNDTAKELELSKSYVAECVQIANAVESGRVKLEIGIAKITVLRLIRDGKR